MPITLVSQTTGGGTNGGTSAAIDTTGATLLVVAVAYASSAPVVADSKGNAWNAATEFSSGVHRARFFYCFPSAVGANHTVTLSGSSSYAGFVFCAFSGTAASNALDGISGGAAYATAAAVGLTTIAPVGGGELILGLAAHNGNATNFAPAAGWAMVSQQPFVLNSSFGLGLVYQVQDAATPIAATQAVSSWTPVVLTVMSGVSFKAVAAVTFSLTGASAGDGFIFQRTGSFGTVSLPLSYTGTPAAIEARLVHANTGEALPGFDWATKVASPSGGAATLTWSGVPQGGWYRVQIRDAAKPASVTQPASTFGIGVRIALTGQSNIEALSIASVSTGAGTASPLVRVYDRLRSPGTWRVPSVSGEIALGNELVAALGGAVPVGLLQYAASGAGLHVGTGIATGTNPHARSWLETNATAGYLWFDFSTAMATIGASVELLVYGQGESDAMTAVSPGTYGTDLQTLISQFRALLGSGLQIVLPLLGQSNGSATDANWELVRQAQLSVAGAVPAVHAVAKYDLACSAGTPDLSPVSFDIWAKRLGRKLAHVMGLESYGNSPSIHSTTAVSSTVGDMTLTHRVGTDSTPAAPT